MPALTEPQGQIDPKLVILQAEGGTTVQAYLDDAVPVMDDNTYDGWDRKRRPGRRGYPSWKGLDCPAVVFGLMLDGMSPGKRDLVLYSGRGPVARVAHSRGPGVLSATELPAAGTSVRAAMRALETMTGALVPNDPKPPLVTVTAPRVPHDMLKARQNRWRLARLSWDERRGVTSDDTGEPILMFAKVTLLLDGSDQVLERVEPRNPAPRYDVEPARTGDTYEKIAARKLGSRQLGRKLAKLNGDRDPGKELRRGHKVRLPSSHTLELWKRELKGRT